MGSDLNDSLREKTPEGKKDLEAIQVLGLVILIVILVLLLVAAMFYPI